MSIKIKMFAAFSAWAVLLSLVLWDEAQAGGSNHNITINNYYDTPTPDPAPATEVLNITSGISNEDLAEGLTMALAAGGHQLDYGTYDWQGSIVGSWETGEDQNAVSFALGKHFKGMDTLLHTSYTQSNSNHYITFGGTFRF